VVNEPDHTAGEWALADYEYQRPPVSLGYYALSWSGYDVEKPFVTASTLISPAIDADLQGMVSVTFDYTQYLWAVTFGPHNVAMIEVWDGEDWQLAMDWSSGVGTASSPPLDITAQAAGNQELRIRFRHENSLENAWWAVDNVSVTAEIYNSCTTEYESP
jgi:hypothetical protein